MKPIIYGTIASLLLGVPAIVNAPVGLGFAFTANTLRARLLRLILAPALRLLMNPRRGKVVFENEDDLNCFVERGTVRASDAVLIRGAGVDVTKFRMLPEPDCGPVVVTLTARMLRDKGVYEFVEAAALIKKQGVSARFLMVGSPDPANPASIPQKTLKNWVREGSVEWLGHRTDIAELLAASHIVCLPSYREGLPKSLLEALACGRAVVTTDVPGCRQTVSHGHNGLLVPPRDPAALAAALLLLIQNASKRKQLGANGRKMAEEFFSSGLIVSSTIRLYESIGPH
jgi:glycosyltransferase involved in cell wall biosynthesis